MCPRKERVQSRVLQRVSPPDLPVGVSRTPRLGRPCCFPWSRRGRTAPGSRSAPAGLRDGERQPWTEGGRRRGAGPGGRRPRRTDAETGRGAQAPEGQRPDGVAVPGVSAPPAGCAGPREGGCRPRAKDVWRWRAVPEDPRTYRPCSSSTQLCSLAAPGAQSMVPGGRRRLRPSRASPALQPLRGHGSAGGAAAPGAAGWAGGGAGSGAVSAAPPPSPCGPSGGGGGGRGPARPAALGRAGRAGPGSPRRGRARWLPRGRGARRGCPRARTFKGAAGFLSFVPLFASPAPCPPPLLPPLHPPWFPS